MQTHLWCWLHPGDSFSLLVNKHTFRVFAAQSEREMEGTLRNSQVLDEEDMSNETPESPVPNLPDQTAGATQLRRHQELTQTKAPATDSMSFLGECVDFSKQQSNPTQRKRILPAWMLADNLSNQTHSTPVISGDNNVIQRHGKEGICEDKLPVSIIRQGRKRLISSGNLERVSAEQDAGKKCKNYDHKGPNVSSKGVPESSSITLSDPDTDTVKSDAQSNKVLIEEVGEVSKQKTITNTTTDTEHETMSFSESPSNVPIMSFPEKSQGSLLEYSSDPSSSDTLHTDTTDSFLGGSEETKANRTSCMYGANCYRKNPVHFQHFSHPGDSDYGDVQVTDETMTDDQPECPYGTSCYRKNPQHKIEYRHSTLPVRVAVKEDSDDVGQPRENDLNDSFLDDEEEEYEPTDEDSDWQPEKEDEEKEEVEELLKEAKKFMKRKK